MSGENSMDGREKHEQLTVKMATSFQLPLSLAFGSASLHYF